MSTCDLQPLKSSLLRSLQLCVQMPVRVLSPIILKLIDLIEDEDPVRLQADVIKLAQHLDVLSASVVRHAIDHELARQRGGDATAVLAELKHQLLDATANAPEKLGQLTDQAVRLLTAMRGTDAAVVSNE
jgi:hypothetical protein